MDIPDYPAAAQEAAICRICHLEDTQERSLYHPCVCTGSVKNVHQACLIEWIRSSGHKKCEICKHRYLFSPIYAHDMPQQLLTKDVIAGVGVGFLNTAKLVLHSTVLALTWTYVLPLSVCRTYRCLFNDTFDPIKSLHIDVWSNTNINQDILQGYFIVFCVSVTLVKLFFVLKESMDDFELEWLEMVMQRMMVMVRPAPQENADWQDDAESNDEEDDDDDWEEIAHERIASYIIEIALYVINSVTLLCAIAYGNIWLIMSFVFLPYQTGNLVLYIVDIKDAVVESHLRGMVTTFFGYVVIGIVLKIVHAYAATVGYRHQRLIELSCIAVKVFIISFIECGVLPLAYGWWLDICSLSMFDTNFEDRLASLSLAPWTSTSIHWLSGVVIVKSLNSFVMNFRLVVGPGVLLLIRDLSSFDFSSRKELAHQGLLQHGQRLVTSAMVFCTSIYLAVKLPITILQLIWPSCLPYTVTSFTDSVIEVYTKLLLVLLITQLSFRVRYISNWLKKGIRFWCVVIGGFLGIESYLLGDGQEPPLLELRRHEIEARLRATHEELLRRGGPAGFNLYARPPYFAIRRIALFVLLALSVVIVSFSVITLPVWSYRLAMSFWLLFPHNYFAQFPSQFSNVLEMHTTQPWGPWFISCLLFAIFISVLFTPTFNALFVRLAHWLIFGPKKIDSFIVFVVQPCLCAMLIERVIIVPIQVPSHQTPPWWPLLYWLPLGVQIMSVLYFVLVSLLNCDLTRELKREYENGLKPSSLAALSLSLAIPYVVAHSIVPLIVEDEMLKLIIARQIYPILILPVMIIKWTTLLLKSEYEYIKHKVYLVGWVLENYNPGDDYKVDDVTVKK